MESLIQNFEWLGILLIIVIDMKTNHERKGEKNELLILIGNFGVKLIKQNWWTG